MGAPELDDGCDGSAYGAGPMGSSKGAKRFAPAESAAQFAKTRWSLVAKAVGSDDSVSRDALNELCLAYWWPMYAYVRRLGRQSDDAAEVVQGLIIDIVERRRLVSADAGRGRFRDWLKTALKFHLGHVRERDQAKKRGGGLKAVALDEVEAERRWSLVANRELDPERLFDRAWALEVLDRALQAVEQGYAMRGRGAAFAVLKGCLVPGSTQSGLAVVAARLGMSEGAVKVEVHRLRRRYKDALKRELRSTVEDPLEADAEYAALLAALGP